MHGLCGYCDSAPLRLDLLSTCRKVHNEAFYVFWSTSLFRFDDRITLSQFYKFLAPRQRISIRRVRLYIENFLGTSHVGWDPALTRTIWESFSNLRHLELLIAFYTSPSLPENGRRRRESHLSEFILNLAAIPLASAYVWIGRAKLDDKTFNETHEPGDKACSEVCAERIRKMLLDVAYARDQCAKQKVLDDDWARMQGELQLGPLGVQRGLSSNPYR